MEQGGAFICTTHMPSYRHATLACSVEKRHLSKSTHSLRRRNHNMEGEVRGGET